MYQVQTKNINIIKILNILQQNAVHIQDTEIKTDLLHIQDITIMNTTTENPDTAHAQETTVIITIEAIMTTPLLIIVVGVVITANTIITILQEVAVVATATVVVIIHIMYQLITQNPVHGLQNHLQLIIYIQLLGTSTVYSIVSISNL